jgi:uncharacterized protein YcbK (DUF882 family)
MQAYSQHFTAAELNCRCGCKPPTGVAINLAKLAQALEALRVLVGGPIHITSGYRCPEHNKRVGGADLSQHTQGLAADIVVKGMTPRKVASLAARVPVLAAGGIGTYRGWVHIDVRPNGPARWQG